MPGLGIAGAVPRGQQRGWYKRRLPLLTPIPGPNVTAGTVGLGGGVPRNPGGGVFVGAGALTLSHPAVVYIGRVPRAGSASVPSGVLANLVLVPQRHIRRAVVRIHTLPAANRTPPRPMPPAVMRSDYQRGGVAYWMRPPLKAPPPPVSGGVIVPFVVRSDYRRAGLAYRFVPPLKAPPPPVAGGVPSPWVVRSDQGRPGLIYRLPLVFVPPPLMLEGTTWISFFSEARQLEWFSWNRSLTWEPGMATYLTKRTAENRLYVMDFSELPEVMNANLASVTNVVSTPLTVDATNLAIGAFAVGSNGKTAQVWISSGQAGASYQIAFTVMVTGGTVLEEFGYLLVEDE